MNNTEVGLALIDSRCSEEGGLTQASLQELREALGFGRLGKWVLEEIKKDLESYRLGWFPTNILEPEINAEPRQWQQVWIYRKDESPLARVLDAVLTDNAPADRVRATLTGIRLSDEVGLTAEQKLERIRQIVGPNSA
ncbi:hypothetical protein GFY24_38970 [Nocardia sp. SYP-A9097]|uniref:hypothetical protein n=1 Tax=Nocardia sp. SYP-A9097 TaxID=2663237 RepID=UPI00129ACAE6|nr:hypothetical protein [Nocardia sp. SYP-A9097]MRH93333.1 hypothetical protein [Nocardia sp. SYP-A9097]